MTLQKRPDAIIRTGLVFLIFGALSIRFLSHSGLSENIADGITGFFYGAAIACMLLGIRLKSRHASATGGNCLRG